MPSFAESLAPRDERKPRLAAESDRDQMPVWLLGRVDFDGPWCWKRMDGDTLHRVHERLCAFERMTFKEIDGKRNHEIPVERLGKAARDRLVELGIDEYDEVLSLRVTRAERVWGLKAPNGIYLLWWDPAHTVYPMNIRDN
ncbi:MAG TPA: hypothetical protein VFJ82_21800 [Longimicrobium sp.]|nr:hypothetical protein [Longimicrobium sp.]